tara:strand:+ start:738 stop:869 length:132 start_codon:yes stop_codon:yes gene_type:complete
MIIPNLAYNIYSVAVGAGSRMLNLWNKLSRRWEVEARNWENIS